MVRTSEEFTEEDVATLRYKMAQTFQEAQKKVSNHRKGVALLKGFQDTAAKVGLEQEFNSTFVRLLNRVLPVKKSEPCAKNIVKFCGNFVGSLTEEQVDEESVTMRFLEHLAYHLLQGVSAKDKNVRFRCCQLIAIVMNHMEDLGDDLFDALNENLTQCLRDKENGVRAEAIVALSRLQGVDEVDTVTDSLLDCMQNDPGPEVRRACLSKLERNSENLRFLLERAWDTNPSVRRDVYSKVMRQIGSYKHLTIKMREQLLRWGLGDRDANVKTACIEMFVTQWFNAADNNLLKILECLDVLNSQIAETAMLIFFQNRKDTLDKIEFVDDFWQFENLTPESVFLARTFNAYCVENKIQDLAEVRMPELTRLAALIAQAMDQLRQDHDDETNFIVEQLLTIAETYDYGDEVGRRNMLSLLRDALVRQFLTPELIQRGVEVIRKLSVSESDFSQVLVEVAADIRDTLEEESNDEKELVALLSCLSITQSVMQLIEKPLESNVHLTSLLKTLILPAVRSHNTPVREKGLRCLGLSCLLSKQLAIENLQLFMACYAADDDLKMECVKIITDMLQIHGASICDEEESEVDVMSVYKLFYKAANNCDEPEIQALAAEALCKLVMSGIFVDDDLIKALVLVFFDGGSAENHALKQTLNFCLPVYCYSSVENQKRMGRVAVDAFRRALKNDNEFNMVTPTQMLQQLIDWTDPQRLVVPVSDSNVHIDLSVDILRRVRKTESKDERKALCGALNKLHYPHTADVELLQEIHQEAERLGEEESFDSVSRNALTKFTNALAKALVKLIDVQPKLENPEKEKKNEQNEDKDQDTNQTEAVNNNQENEEDGDDDRADDDEEEGQN